ncbi:MAG TPA: hypothetical protein VNB90_00795 [Cytophagaceae bacterium]|jgi:hypothetical protein|nr:hypothetical protein [Cytophagaceae bacterium]
MIRSFCILIIIVLSCASCHSQKVISGGQTREYKEDYSSLRPKYDVVEEKKTTVTVNTTDVVVPKNDINKFLAEKLDSVYSYNLGITSADGYRILVYVGASSEEARNQRSYAYQVLPLERSYTEWKQPNFKVKVGDFVDKLEAYYAYSRLVQVFPNAIVVPDKVNIVRENK